MPSTRLSRIDFAMMLLPGISFEFLYSLSIDVADGPEDEDGDAGKREQAQMRQEHGPGDGVLGDGREKGDGASRPQKGDDRPCRRPRGSSYDEFRRCSHSNAPLLIEGRGKPLQRVDCVLNGVDLEGPRRSLGVGQLRKRRGEPEPVVARHVER